MQGYGPRRRLLPIAVLGAAVALISGCSMLESQAEPDRIVIPATDTLSTESKPSSLAATSRSAGPDDTTLPSEWSFERVIKAAPRVSNTDYHEGATTPAGERLDVSGFHFSTEDRSVRCSTGNNGAGALVCVADSVRGPAQAPAGEDPGCRWGRGLAVLSSDGVSEGGCENRYPVLYRSGVVASGSSIVVDRFACLTDGGSLYCVESRSGDGFAITSSGFRSIRAEDRAPKSLSGVDSEKESSSSSSRVVETR